MTIPTCEPFEPRRLLSISLVKGTLFVQDQNQMFFYLADDDHSKIVAEINGTKHTYSHAEVKLIRVDGSAGDDDIWASEFTGHTAVDVPLLAYGGGAHDDIFGGSANDTIYGEEADDWLDGGDGNDVIRGGPGPDSISGDAGNDKLYGDAGRDSIVGGK